jgi:hypothetical protein
MIRAAILATIFSSLLISGCVSAPPKAVGLAKDYWSQPERKVGVVMTAVPKLDVYLPGAGCLLCMAVAEGANSALSKHIDTLTQEDVPELGKQMVVALKAKGVDAILIEEKLNLDKLPKFSSKDPNAPKKNFSKFRDKYGISQLVVINITMLGMHRSYSGYVATSDPKAVFAGSAYIVDLATNSHSAYKTIEIYRSVSDKWDEPPSFPALTNAYYQALEVGKETVISVTEEGVVIPVEPEPVKKGKKSKSKSKSKSGESDS